MPVPHLVMVTAVTFGGVSGSYLGVGLAIAVVVVGSRSLAKRTGIPYPVFLVVAGSAASFVPDLGHITLDPQVVFLGFLPPLVYHAGAVTSPRDLRANALPIALGAFGLVLATTFAVAGVAWAAVPAFGWAGAFVLGAVVAPTDPVAATSVFDRLGVPSHVSTILEGESLVNDGISLALFTLGISAVAAPVGLTGGLVDFVKIAGGGIAFGLVVGLVVVRVRRPASDTASQIVVSLLVPYLAYLPADALGLSGVLATLTAGLVIGERPASGLAPSGRIRMSEFWQVLVFLLESVLFVLVGLQLRELVAGISSYSDVQLALVVGLAVTVVIGVRLLWWLVLPTIRWKPEGRLFDTGEIPRSERIALGWSGLRGAISLAAALSIPAAVAGHRFRGRDLVIFTTFCVILATLVGQGTSLPVVLRRLGLSGSGSQQRERVLAQRRLSEGALRLVDELVGNEEISDDMAELLRERYERRLARARSLAEEEGTDTVPIPSPDLERRLLEVQLQAITDLHRKGQISTTVMRQVRRELDLEHAGPERLS